MNARSALFDVYGDHLQARGGEAPVAALVRLLATLDIAAPAVRTAISRMVRQEWLEPVRLDAGAAYRLTAKAERRLTDAAQRIYRRDLADWDRRWHLLVLDRIPERGQRARVRSGLTYLGYAPLHADTWISPHESDEVEPLLASEDVQGRRFSADHVGDDARLTAATWDLDQLAALYRRWLTEAELVVAELARSRSAEARDSDACGCDEQAFIVRSRLVHEWRKFLFLDPGLPVEVLPADWPGLRAAQFFDEHTGHLREAAERYVDSCLRIEGDRRE
ncbi:MAG: PaaX family transcriptional regulator C-terminal domain-containing protein [Nocardioidaceae bacterium]